MTREITTATDLEDITTQLGCNMALEKAVIQDEVVSRNVYDTAMQSSELLLKIGRELIGVLGGRPFSKNLDVPNSNYSTLSVNKRGRLRVETAYQNSVYLDSRIHVYPQKDKVLIKIREDHSNLKRAGLLAGTAATFPLVFIGGPAIALPLLFASLPNFYLCLDEDERWSTQHVYKHKEFFRNINAFASRHTQEKTDRFVDYYLSLPGIVYNAVEGWIRRNESTMKGVDTRQNEYAKLEEKLR